jgi:hypothetical protein
MRAPNLPQGGTANEDGDEREHAHGRSHSDRFERDPAAARPGRDDQDGSCKQCRAHAGERDVREAPQQQARLRPGGHARLERPERELGDEQERHCVEGRSLVERTAFTPDQDRVLSTEEDDPPADQQPPASGEARTEQSEPERGQAKREPLLPRVRKRRVRGEGSPGDECRERSRYARTTRAWRLNPLTPSMTESSPTPSRHSTTGTPSAA